MDAGYATHTHHEENEPVMPQGRPEFDPSYVERNVDYYADQYETYRRFGRAGFNWAAFFFPIWWSFYRKLYVFGFIMLVINLFPGLQLISNFLAGFFGNKEYLKQMADRLSVGDRSQAGVNRWIYVVGVFGTLLITALSLFIVWYLFAITKPTTGAFA